MPPTPAPTIPSGISSRSSPRAAITLPAVTAGRSWSSAAIHPAPRWAPCGTRPPARTAGFAAPDNCAIDHRGRLWVATDQGSNWATTGTADGVWALETQGERRGTGKMFFRVPLGAEMCGPCFSPDDGALFVAVQHPAADGTEAYAGRKGRPSTFEDPATRWPDFQDGMPPRPSLVVITRRGGGAIG
ncbi:DUF839 domain-containing protein [Halomonas piscis]|uniref:DUF839 domain-containing protein n=1 Tax=Halomonas piscis TaxID=3031727 RepID=A0ABY9Z4H0_9GAMM|nr:alkaline phosphatase PhoX [Halomonas piscis]WNK21625.1 DUF839 domain-containing protein [Halomonas piscis]